MSTVLVTKPTIKINLVYRLNYFVVTMIPVRGTYID